ncbi:MAG: GntR family transcriptional regulator [Clostridiales bacterium]|nr:GntR family transcriptional regulator [Clostridiales bacterium]
MFQLDLRSHLSIYEQVIDNIKELIVCGAIEADSKLPSVRDLSKVLAVNPNTVQKSFKELERQGFIYTVAGKGTFVCKRDEKEVDQESIDRVTGLIEQNVRELYFIGVSRNEVEEILMGIAKNSFKTGGGKK